MIGAETIYKCFRKAGVLDSAMEVVTRGLEENDEDSFLYSELLMQQRLIDKTTTSQENCTLDESLMGTTIFQCVCGLDNDSWDDNLLAQLGYDVQEIDEIDESDKEIELNDEFSPLKVQSIKEALNSLKKFDDFLKPRF
ncbi:hypothetical protein LOD99_6074 [Oopsacas minuta]|uniref:Uncharacterized protein n=1 Tax=Oopsacas minuta TaxID=111878 RepID=A0AAV7JMW2_9METZ|nr:hypothetical protein LOD99_6074 [Oopsacas minuta]